MSKAVLLLLFGCLLGLVGGISLMAFIIMSPSLSEQKSLGDFSNLVVAVGTLFTLGYTMWQHRETIEAVKRGEKPRLQLVGAPLQLLPAPIAQPLQIGTGPVQNMTQARIEFQFLNSGRNAAADLRLRAYACPISSPAHLTCVRDDTIANPIFGEQGFHWPITAGFSTSIPAQNNEMLIHLKLDYKNDDEDGEKLQTEYFLKVNPNDATASNMTQRELAPLKSYMKP
jgi:hypothetical protein